jgi:hypothetical protein
LSTTPSVLAVVVEPLELVDDQRKLLVAKASTYSSTMDMKDDNAKHTGEDRS